MSTTTRDNDQAASQARQEIRRTQQLAHAAIDALDPPLAVALCRSLRSMLWRARNEKIDLSEPATGSEGEEG